MFEKLQKSITTKTKIAIENTIKIINVVKIAIKTIDIFVENISKKQLFAIVISLNKLLSKTNALLFLSKKTFLLKTKLIIMLFLLLLSKTIITTNKILSSKKILILTLTIMLFSTLLLKTTIVFVNKVSIFQKNIFLKLIIMFLLTTTNNVNKNINNLKLDQTYIKLKTDFAFCDFFIYNIKNNNIRFYISKNCIQNIFKLIHNNNFYASYYCVYTRLIKIIYIRKFAKRFIIYIQHCSQY